MKVKLFMTLFLALGVYQNNAQNTKSYEKISNNQEIQYNIQLNLYINYQTYVMHSLIMPIIVSWSTSYSSYVKAYYYSVIKSVYFLMLLYYLKLN